jgi:hypothetical protein
LLASEDYNVAPTFEFGPGAQYSLLENRGKGMGENKLAAGALEQVASALDDLRRLGSLDLTENYPQSK